MTSTAPFLSRRHLMQAGALLLLPTPALLLAQTRTALPLSAAINRAGKIRALAQRSSKGYVQATLGVLPEKAREIMLTSQRVIAGNLEEMGASAPPADIRKLLQTVEKDNAGLATLTTSKSEKAANMDVAKSADAVMEAADKLTRAYETLSQQAGAKIVNIAGRQRMLSQRAARGYFLIAAGNDTPAIRTQLDSARAEFKQGLATLQGAPISTAAIRNELELAKSQWLFYETALVKPPGMDSLQTVATTSERMFEVMDNLTSLYDAALRDVLG